MTDDASPVVMEDFVNEELDDMNLTGYMIVCGTRILYD